MVKVKILKQVGQTGLRLPGTIISVPKSTADHWIKQGWAKKIVKPRAKKKVKDEPKSDN